MSTCVGSNRKKIYEICSFMQLDIMTTWNIQNKILTVNTINLASCEISSPIKILSYEVLGYVKYKETMLWMKYLLATER